MIHYGYACMSQCVSHQLRRKWHVWCHLELRAYRLSTFLARKRSTLIIARKCSSMRWILRYHAMGSALIAQYCCGTMLYSPTSQVRGIQIKKNKCHWSRERWSLSEAQRATKPSRPHYTLYKATHSIDSRLFIKQTRWITYSIPDNFLYRTREPRSYEPCNYKRS